jgi:LuxR family maltose regulon positive regulatory protein
MGLRLAEEDIIALQRRTEGWIAGLQLAALSMQGQADVHRFIEYFSGSNRYILDYLFEEVFAQQTKEMQDFLVRTSILNQLRIDLCDHVVERRDSSKLLESLERANLFILPMDPAREWYRYHRLFRDLLRHRLRVHQGGEEAQLHLRACDWYQRHGFQSDAVQHALAAGDWDRASELVLGVSEAMMKEGKIVTLLGWFRQFPDSFKRAHPRLAIDYIWTLVLTGQIEPARSLLLDIETSPTDDPELLSSIISARAYLARVEGDVPGTIEYSQRALELVPESNVSLRSILAINLGVAYWHTGQMEETSRALEEAMRTAQETGNYYAQLAALIFLGRVEAVRGNLQKAEELFRRAIKYEISAPLTGLAYIDLGALLYEWNDLDARRDNLLKGVEINETGGNFEYQLAGNMLLARLENALGNTESTNEYLRKLQEMERRPTVGCTNGNGCGGASILQVLWFDPGTHPDRRGKKAGSCSAFGSEIENGKKLRVDLWGCRGEYPRGADSRGSGKCHANTYRVTRAYSRGRLHSHLCRLWPGSSAPALRGRTARCISRVHRADFGCHRG